MSTLKRKQSDGTWDDPGGGTASGSASMSEAETQYWQDRAALLDPAAYEFIQGNSISRTVPAGEMWWVVNAWWCEVIESGGGTWFHRQANVDQALPLSGGTTIVTDDVKPGAFAYICKPALVTATDIRYTDDPRGLYFSRVRRIQTLTMHQIGATATSTTTPEASFPTDFTSGLALHTSAHDVAWLILLNASGSGALNTVNEISDSDPIRFAEPTVFPFTRATFPEIAVRGVSLAEGRATLTYVKLPADW